MFSFVVVLCCATLRKRLHGAGEEIHKIKNKKKKKRKKEKEETEDLKTVPSTLFHGSYTTTYMHDLQGK